MVGRFHLHPDHAVFDFSPAVVGGDGNIQAIVVDDPVHRVAAAEHKPLDMMNGQIANHMLARPAFTHAASLRVLFVTSPPASSRHAGSKLGAQTLLQRATEMDRDNNPRASPSIRRADSGRSRPLGGAGKS